MFDPVIKGKFMESDFEIIVSLAVSAVVLIYLLYTLIKPEKF